MTHVLDAIRRAACAGRVPGGKKQKGRSSLAGAGFSCAILQPRYAFAGVLKYHEVQTYASCRLSVSFAVLEEYADCDAELLHC